MDTTLPRFILDSYVDSPLIMMSAVAGDQLGPTMEFTYRKAIDEHWPKTPLIQHIKRFAFYDRTKEAFAILMTRETAKHGNIILKKG